LRKVLLPLTAALALSLAGIAIAANEYTITNSTNPSNAGTKSKPTPISGKFAFQVKDTEGKRPLALDAIRIKFGNTRINTRQFAKCTASQIEQASSDSGCPAGARVASGFANNIAGNINDRNDTSLRCYLTVRLWNSGAGKMALFVQGSPNAPRPCPIEVATAIPVSVRASSTGDTLSFTIPENLKTPVATIRNSLIETSLTIRKLTKKSGGRTVGALETFGCGAGARKNANKVDVTFINEGGNTVRQSGFARCSK